ncbi:MAG: hypothetical protein ACI30C_00680 [Muribaculaceae bacterium]
MIKFLDKAMVFIGKTFLLFLGITTSVFVIIMLLIYVSDWIWPEYNGSYDLGNNIYMLEWDGGGKIIVNGATIEGNTCYGGASLIPTYENQYDSIGNFAEYVVDAKSDDNWVIAKTNNHISHQRKYYILNKKYNPNKMTVEDIISTKIVFFTDSNEFAKKCLRNRIELEW